MEQFLEYIRYFAFTILGGGAGYFIRLIIEHRLAIDRIRETIRITEFNKASAKLRASFASAQVQLCQPRILGNVDARKFFETAIIQHAIAIEEFRPYANDAAKYQKSWDEYQKTIAGDDDMGDAEFKWISGHVTYFGDKENRDLFKEIQEKIENILHFSTPIK